MDGPPQGPPGGTRLYVGNLPRIDLKDPDQYQKLKGEIETRFRGTIGDIKEVKLMEGFGFIEYTDAQDATDMVPIMHGQDFDGQRVTVQFAKGARPRGDGFGRPERRGPGPTPRRTKYRMTLSGLADGTSWQDLKDFARRSDHEPIYSEVPRSNDGTGFVEFETGEDLMAAVEKLDNTEFKGVAVHCVADEQTEVPQWTAPPPRRRSRSPAPYRGGRDDYRDRGYDRGPPPRDDYYGRGPPPRDYDRRDDYRRRSPPRRDDYDRRDRYGSPPPPRGGRYPPGGGDGGYGASRGGYRDEPYGGYPPPRRDDGYGGSGGYDRPPPPPQGGPDRGPPRRSPPARYGGHDDRRY